jgi:methylglyoxal synthase
MRSEHSSGVLCVPSATHVTGYLLITSAALLVMIACYHPVLATAVDYICVQIMKLLRACVISVIPVACNVDSCHQEVVKLCLWN